MLSSHENYYITHSAISDPGIYAHLYNAFSDDISILVKEIQGLFLHYADVNLMSVMLHESRYQELNLRYIQKIINQILIINSNDLSTERCPEKRIMGVCRDTSLLLCSVLRSRGIPARLRSGFVSYFIPGLFLDGFCVEFYDENLQRWRSVDTRTSQLHIDHYHLSIDFDLTDVPNNQFIPAALAWQHCRFHHADPIRYGSRQQRGLFTVRNRLIQDLALLNKQECLIWDAWGPMLLLAITDFDELDVLSNLLIHDINNTKNINNFYQLKSELQLSQKILVDNPFLAAEWITV